jgi:flagellar hook-length control protein FliK
MSPERTSHATSLPVRADREPRADKPAASDTFATLLGAHADRPDRAPSRRERQPAEDNAPRERDRTPVDRPAEDRRPAPAAHRPAKPAAAQTDSTDPAKPAAPEEVAKAALLALAVPAPQPAAPVAGQPVPAVPTAEPARVESQQTPLSPLTLAVAGEQPAPAEQAAQLPQDAAATAGKSVAPVAGQPAPAANVPAASDIPTPALPVDPQAAAAPAADEAAADRAAELPSVPTAPTQRSEVKAPADAAGPATTNALATPAPTGDASARQGDGRAPERDQAQAAPQSVQSAAPAPTTRSDVAPVAAPAPTATPATSRTVTLSQAPRAVGQLIHLASQKGVQHARLNLRPVELGGIEIRLQSTTAGVTAQVVADSPEAARLLQQASDDLKRSLASHNVDLLSLDVSTSGDERRDASGAGDLFGQFDESGTRGQAGSGRPQRSGAGQAESDLPAPTEGTVLELPDGVLVDVLA